MVVGVMLEDGALVSVELEAPAKGRRGPPNVGAGAVTAALLAGKFVYYIGGVLSRGSRRRTIPHNQGSQKVRFTIYPKVNVSLVICGGYSSFYDAFEGITFFLESVMVKSPMVNDK